MRFAITTAINVTHLAARTGVVTCVVLAIVSLFNEHTLGEQVASL